MDKVEVVGHRVLLKPIFEIEGGQVLENDKTDWGFDMSQNTDYKREKAGAVTGVILGIGSMAWRAFDGDRPDWKPWAKVGDKVFFAKHAPKFITINGETLALINDEDVQAVIHSEEET